MLEACHVKVFPWKAVSKSFTLQLLLIYFFFFRFFFSRTTQRLKNKTINAAEETVNQELISNDSLTSRVGGMAFYSKSILTSSCWSWTHSGVFQNHWLADYQCRIISWLFWCQIERVIKNLTCSFYPQRPKSKLFGSDMNKEDETQENHLRANRENTTNKIRSMLKPPALNN